MKSFTKYSLDNTTVTNLFKTAGFQHITGIVPLTAGEFNSAYCVTADGSDYVLKVAPQSGNAHTLTYETDLMRQEVDFYRLIAEKTAVRVPKIYYSNFSMEQIPAAFFIMEKLSGKPLSEVKPVGAERDAVYEKVGELIAELHTIGGERFGYVQNGLFENWYLAVRSMVENLLKDCKNAGKHCKAGEELLCCIDRHQDILRTVPCVYTHFDIWAGNLFYTCQDGEIQLTLIDTERSLWGDGIGDFCSLDFPKPLLEKKSLLKGYNRKAQTPITGTQAEEIRYAVLSGYLGLIMYTERFYRYRKTQIRYLVNGLGARMLLKRVLRTLKG